MLKLSAHIAIGSYSMDYAASVSIESGWDMLTDTATIEMPRRLKFKDKIIAAGENGLFQRGNPVNIQLGYDGRNKTVFSGYIGGIYPGIPVRFECQDELWQLKQTKVTKTYKTIGLRKLLQDICPIPFQSIDAELGEFRIDRASVAQVLNELQKEYGLHSFVRDGKLYCGLAFWPELQQEHVFAFGKNIISSQLEYQEAGEVMLSVEAISIMSDNSKISVKVGEEGGESRTLHFYGITSEKELKARAEAELSKFSFEGYRGSFETFGEPYVRHGDKVIIKDELFGHAPGSYLVKKVQSEWGTSGYRQKITLDRKL